MDKKIKRYYKLKKQQKEIEQELSSLRSEILSLCADQKVAEQELGGYKVKIISQERKEFDDNKLYSVLPDPAVWRMLSKADPAKVASLIHLNIITDDTIKDTFTVKKVTLLQVDKI
ncbi:hypothetical protein [Paenibacillus abyssi]|uniref:Uncharacterized protein n=1 Tax=Paenibacillus abyssi TaxID=1340531 RepID=A0A917CV63_9BACL|nr:hypothetical protein GCM10010916_17370 [Paenibacillus abyssi]